MAGELVLEPQLFFLQLVEKVFVGVGAVFFLVDPGVKRCVLGCQFLDMCLVHRRSSFPGCLWRPDSKTSFVAFVLHLLRRSGDRLERPVARPEDDAGGALG